MPGPWLFRDGQNVVCLLDPPLLIDPVRCIVTFMHKPQHTQTFPETEFARDAAVIGTLSQPFHALERSVGVLLHWGIPWDVADLVLAYLQDLLVPVSLEPPRPRIPLGCVTLPFCRNCGNTTLEAPQCRCCGQCVVCTRCVVCHECEREFELNGGPMER